MLQRALLLLCTCLLIVACGGAIPDGPTLPPGPGAGQTEGASPSEAPIFASESPAGSEPVVNEEFCGTIGNLETALGDFEAIKVTPGDGQKMKTQANQVSRTMTPITQGAAKNLSTLVSALASTVDELNHAAEDYATARGDRNAQQQRVKKAVAAVHAAITALRTGADCTN